VRGWSDGGWVWNSWCVEEENEEEKKNLKPSIFE